jgi:type IV secretory pathway TraG/TraD family ATPase VirD4
MPPETEGGIRAYLRNMLDLFTLEPYSTIFAGHSTMRLGDMIDQGKILYVRLRISDREAMAKIVLTLLKLEYQREILKRVKKPRYSLFMCDEFQTVLTAGEEKGDANFFSMSRGSRHVNLVATQSLQGLKRRSPKEETINDLLSNCAVKIFLHGDDKQTNEFASELFGREPGTMPGTSVHVGGGLPGASKINTGVVGTAQDSPVVRPEEFLKLKSPGQGRDFTESIAQISTRDNPIKPYHLRWPVHPLPTASSLPILRS